MDNTVLYYNYTSRAADVLQSAETNILVANALRYVIQNVFTHYASSFVITIATRFKVMDIYFHDILERLVKTFGFMAVQLVTLNKDHLERVPGRRFCNMIFIDSFKSLVNANLASYTKYYDSNEYYFIFLQMPDPVIMAEMKLIFNYCLENYWINCNVMVQTSMAAILVFTYFPFTEQHCHQAEAVLVNWFDDENMEMMNHPMFPDKLVNMHECVLKLAIWHVPPFVELEEQDDGSLIMSGFEIYLVKELRDSLNFSIHVVIPGVNEITDVINGTLRGSLGLLESREADFSLGYFRRTHWRDELATSVFSHYHVPQVATIIQNNHKYSSLEILTFPFHPQVWLMLLASILILFQLGAFYKRLLTYWNFFDPTFKMIFSKLLIIKILFGLPLVHDPETPSRRLMYLSWVFGVFVLRAVYQSRLFHLFRTQLYRQAPDTLDALILANYKAVGTENALVLLQDIPQIASGQLQYIALNSTNELDLFKYLEEHQYEDLTAITAEDFVFRYGPMKKPQTEFKILPQCVNKQQITIYLTKHSYLIDKFNERIQRFLSFGLIEAWHRWTIDYEYGNTVTTPTQQMIGQKELSGIYYISFVLWTCAFIVFLFELLIDRRNRRLRVRIAK